MATITYRMDSNKNLVSTSSATIYQQEQNIDSIAILIPLTYNDIDLADFNVELRYIDLENNIHHVTLEKDEEIYKEAYYRYIFQITNDFTKIAGKISFRLELNKADTDEIVAHTGDATITILPWKDYKLVEN